MSIKVQVEWYYCQQKYCYKRGWTFKHQKFASLYFSSGLTNNYLALVVIFNKIISISSCSGLDVIKYPACGNTRALCVTSNTTANLKLLSMLDRQSLITELKNASNSGSLLTLKHDPNSGVTWKRFRTVLTQQASGSLQNLIESEQYDFEAYYNNQHQKYSYKLIPYESSSFTTVGLGIPSGSLETTGSFDTFLIASGSTDGWHIYSEDSAKMQSQLSGNTIEFKGKL
jgi:hypothetical protein